MAQRSRSPDAPPRDRKASREEVAQPLFRSEVMRARRGQWLGPVLLVSPLSHAIWALLAIAVVVALVAFVTFGEFTRKVRVNGWLVPSEGMVRVFVQQPGVVEAIRVREGDVVARGAPLMVVSAERRSSAVGATQAEITRLLGSRRTSVEAEIVQQQALFAQQRSALERRADAMRSEIEQFNREIALQASRAELATRAAERMQEVARRGAASLQEVEQHREAELEQRARQRQLERARTERQRELVALQAELADLPLKHRTQLAALQREISTLEQDTAESEARRESVLLAPQGGTVTAIQAEVGGSASPATPLLSIVPEASKLEAQLFANSRAIGFVRPGQPVLLRMQAFPYQKFGHVRGTVESVSRAALSPTEVPTQLAGLSSLLGSNEPIYRIVVRLERQAVTAYGVPQPLQPGMQLESDVLLERRRLWEWALEPLFTLTGRLS
ncbi:MAG: HlyD family efflux transporter periplasmic adaptor subunit [Burkholderiales bacterium]